MAPDTPGGFTGPEMRRILERAARAAGIDHSGARLLRGQTNAVVLLEAAGVVAKVARKGSRTDDAVRTVVFVRWLTSVGFPTVPLHPGDQPVVVDGHPVTFWQHLPQPPHPVAAHQLAGPLRTLHTLPAPPVALPARDDLAAIRRSLSATTCLPPRTLARLGEHADRLEADLAAVRELRMITTNARKVHHAPATLEEVERRVDGLLRGDPSLRWNIL